MKDDICGKKIYSLVLYILYEKEAKKLSINDLRTMIYCN